MSSCLLENPVASSAKWPVATRERPCPKCGKTNRCRITPDGRAGICWRRGTSEPWHDSNRNGNRHKADPKPAPPKATFINAEAAIKATTPPGGKLVNVWSYPADKMRVARFNMLEPGEKEFRPVHQLDNGGVGNRRSAQPATAGSEVGHRV